MGTVLAFQHRLTTETCCSCGVEFAIPEYLQVKLRENHRAFYCPNGHPQAYQGENEAQKFERLYKREQQRREWAEKNEQTARRSERIARGKLKAQSQRVKAGVCPCCKRTFQQLARHMACKHPGWSESDG